MRGKEKYTVIPNPVGGITPACAGKSFQLFSQNLSQKDHPRLCGEKLFACVFPPLNAGSPPLVRGKGIAENEVYKRERITPACAGKSSQEGRALEEEEDHPRLCGEKGLYVTSISLQ